MRSDTLSDLKISVKLKRNESWDIGQVCSEGASQVGNESE